ncbi:MurR/RpiR family transcriptional regulator [Sulfitobacter sp.]|uniref:MurR/RpiR family transcriptional regulator n=1 Tax=Sulfitobacter sp. TaxID=1903071 RepID=UPI0030039130
MNEPTTIQDRINTSYAGLSDKLQIAAKFAAKNPVDIATRSLRSVAASTGVSPATFSRLARALGYADYEQMRQDGRETVERKMAPFSERAHALRLATSEQGSSTVLHRQATACISNIENLHNNIDPDRLNAAVQCLHDARTVLLIGAMGSAGIIDYFGYMAQWFKGNWKTVGRNGTELSPSLSRLGSDDVVFALAKAPYARRTIAALKTAREAGATTVVITDSRTSPALQFSNHSFVVSTESPQFFSSYAATLVLMETIISLLLARAGSEAEGAIRAAEVQINQLGENWIP